MAEPITLTVCTDYNVGTPAGRFEYLIRQGARILARRGLYPSYGAAKRAGIRAAQPFLAAD